MNRIMIRVRYEGGVFRPLDRLDFRDGEEFEIVIVRKKFRGFHEKFKDVIIESDRDILRELLNERREVGIV